MSKYDIDEITTFHQILNEKSECLICKECSIKYMSQVILQNNKVLLLLKVKKKFSYDLSDTIGDFHIIDIIGNNNSNDKINCAVCKKELPKREKNDNDLMCLDTIGNLHIKLEYQNEEYKKKLITEIDKQITQLELYKKQIEESYLMNKKINSDLFEIIKMIFNTKPKKKNELELNPIKELINIPFLELNNLSKENKKFQNSEIYTLLEKKKDILVQYFQKNFLIKLGPIECIKTIKNHINSVNALCIINNDFFASGSNDKTINIYNAHTYELIRFLKGHSGFIYSLTYSQKNNCLISSDDECQIKFWNIQNLYNVKNIYNINKDESFHHIFTLNNQYDLNILCAPLTNKIMFYNIDNYQEYINIPIEKIKKKCVMQLNSNDKIIVPTNDNNIHILKNITFETEHIMKNIEKDCVIITIKQYGHYKILIGLSTFIIKIYDLRTYDCVDEIKVYNLNCMIYLKNGKIFTGSHDGYIRMFNIYSGDCIYRILEHKYCVNCFIQFNDGRVLSGASDGLIKVWW